MTRRFPAMVLLAGLFGTASCARPPRASAVLITIDTLRADHLGCYGYAPPTSPHIDALARQGTLFRQARTTLPRTTQSVASILTGRLPKTHGARGLFAHLPEANLTIAEALQQAGYRTAAVVSNTFLRRGQGFEQGFETYDNPEARWDADSAAAVSDAAIAWLDRAPQGAPFFLWVHYLDPHWRYEPDPSWARTFDPSFEGPFTVYQDLDARRYTKGRMIFDPPLTPRQHEHVAALYDGEIAQTDAAVGRLLARLDRVAPSLLVVLTSDHGESLGEHGYHFAHGEYLYEQGRSTSTWRRPCWRSSGWIACRGSKGARSSSPPPPRRAQGRASPPPNHAPGPGPRAISSSSTRRTSATTSADRAAAGAPPATAATS
jgi:arylsulfatase